MASIETPQEDQWDGELADLRDKIVDRDHGRVDNILQIHALNPQAMAAHSALYTSAMSGTRGLRKVDRELIALIVSNINECHY